MAQTNLQINTTNPEAITYTTEEIAYTILGGIRLEGLDRLRVTLKIEVINRKFVHYLNNPDIAALAIRQNLDLYSLTQTEKLARLIADRLEVGITQVTKDLSDITNELERYRLQQIESKQQEQTKIVKPLTEAEYQAAIQFLQSKNLLQATNELIGKSGIVGEELNRLIMWLIYTSRKTSKPLHIISMGSSGTGKSHLQEKVGDLIPDEDKIEITALTENAFYYFDKAELGHKLILIEDLDGILAALYPLRELQSKQRISKTVTVKDKNGNTKTIYLKVYGPVCIAGDPDGKFPYPIFIRSFAPFVTFGGGFAGDNRGWSTSSSVTSRMQQTFTIDPAKGTVTDGGAWSNASHHRLFGTKTATDRHDLYAKFNKSRDDNVAGVSTDLAANLPLIPSPDIDVHSAIKLTENTKKGILNVKFAMSGDGFPAAEAFISDTKGQRVFIGVAPYAGDPLSSLPGDSGFPMMYANFDIKINDKGEFVSVVSGGKTYSINEWNKKISGTPLEYNESLKHDNDGRSGGVPWSGDVWSQIKTMINDCVRQNPNIQINVGYN